MRSHGKTLGLLSLAALALAAGTASAASVSAGLRTCAAITGPSERLACYDQLAGRVPQSSSAATAPPVAPSPSAPSAPAANVAHNAGLAPTVASPTPAPSTPAPPAPESKDSFGLYTAEHTTPVALAQKMQAIVIGFGRSSQGVLVMLEGGQTWQMEESDPLLKSGDLVTIKRASFGSFLLTTPDSRTHRVRRMK